MVHYISFSAATNSEITPEFGTHQLNCTASHLKTLQRVTFEFIYISQILHGSAAKMWNQHRQHNKQVLLLTRPRGPIFGAKEDVAPTSPPTHLRYTEN
jgi:hypothetical protein